MSDAYMGTIQGFGFNFPPRGWANCNGALLSISQNTALFSLLSTMYGGDGRTTFGLPDLRGRVALNMGQGPGLPNYREGVKGGTYTHTITTAQMPSHRHTVQASSSVGSTNNPSNAYMALAQDQNRNAVAVYGTTKNVTMNADAIGLTGSGTAYNTMNPYQVIEMCIALQGLYPSRN